MEISDELLIGSSSFQPLRLELEAKEQVIQALRSASAPGAGTRFLHRIRNLWRGVYTLFTRDS
jgi:hypothetical protein